jgi:hypothetical protein
VRCDSIAIVDLKKSHPNQDRQFEKQADRALRIAAFDPL